MVIASTLHEGAKPSPGWGEIASASWRLQNPFQGGNLPAEFNLSKLIVDVFAPERGERVTVLTDRPRTGLLDLPAWVERRQMATEWQQAFVTLGAKLGFAVNPLVTYDATGANNAPLPEHGQMGGELVRLIDVLEKTTLAVAITEFSATATLVECSQRFPDFRGASLPMLARRMEQTALAADYSIIGPRTRRLAEKLEAAQAAYVRFDTGHAMTFDLRYRHAHADDGLCPRHKQGMRVINLPSGEAYITPYEGEHPHDRSRTSGQIPVMENGELIVFRVVQNRIVEIEGTGVRAAELRTYFALDHARRNVAELGLGCNDQAVVWGNVLEDEKAGFHWAYGRSEHLGGTVGPEAFLDPGHIIHQDIVYARGSPIVVSSLTLDYGNGVFEEIMRDGWYVNV